MAFFIAATTTNKIENYTTSGDVTYVARRTAEGKTKSEIIRCLKRHLARELWATMRPLRTAHLDVEHAA